MALQQILFGKFGNESSPSAPTNPEVKAVETEATKTLTAFLQQYLPLQRSDEIKVSYTIDGNNNLQILVKGLHETDNPALGERFTELEHYLLQRQIIQQPPVNSQDVNSLFDLTTKWNIICSRGENIDARIKTFTEAARPFLQNDQQAQAQIGSPSCTAPSTY